MTTLENEKGNDVVYLVGPGTAMAFNELRYSLRSLDLYMKNYRNVFIVGLLPAFIDPDKVIHIEQYDQYENPAKNIATKVLAACLDERLSDEFVFMNDDYFLLKPIDATNYPHFYKNTLEQAMQMNRGSSYLWHLKQTYDILRQRNKPLKNFDGHCPMIFKKSAMTSVIGDYPWNVKNGYTLRSLYCNSLFIEGELRQDMKFNTKRDEQKMRKALVGKDCFSIGDGAVNRDLRVMLQDMFPQPSKFEK